MVGQLNAPGFGSGAEHALARQTSCAIAAVFATGALSLSLLIAIAMLSLQVLHAPTGPLL